LSFKFICPNIYDPSRIFIYTHMHTHIHLHSHYTYIHLRARTHIHVCMHVHALLRYILNYDCYYELRYFDNIRLFHKLLPFFLFKYKFFRRADIWQNVMYHSLFFSTLHACFHQLFSYFNSKFLSLRNGMSTR